ncbi:acyl-CoA thioesterase [Brevibacterium litoralis]|uniref:acyl-CoA thioesterase n=1 Tax=Brevibacterium litoralis TaxID=3138935 RepID=UPI0032EC4CDC
MGDTFTWKPQIRWSDMDVLGHVNNARIVTLIEEARINWLVGMADRDTIGQPKLVAHLDLDYLHPVEHGPELEIVLGIARVGSKSFTINAQGFQDGTKCFVANNVMVPIDQETLRPSGISEADKEYLRTFLVEG